MHGFSTVDGFVEISNCLAEMIKYVANEPSTGLFFIQHHTQNVVPNVMKLKNNIVDKCHETTLHRQDLEDSVTMVKSMKECGFPIADEMIRDIEKSMVTMTTKHPKGRRPIHHSTSYFQIDRAHSAIYSQEGSEIIKGNYFSSVFSFSKQKSNRLMWPRVDSTKNFSIEKSQIHRNVSLPVTSVDAFVASQDDSNLPLSNQVEDDEKFDDFKASKQAKLEEWLGGTSNHGKNCLLGNE